MGGKRTSKEELAQLEALTKEGLTCREIAEKLGRSPAAIRNLRYKKHLVSRAQDETKALFQQRDQLNNMMKILQGQKTMLAIDVDRLKKEVDGLKKEKERLEGIIILDKVLLQQTLSQALVNLKQYRPDLFTLSGPEQIGMILKAILK
jgi:predicted transcriptional regulator